MNEIERAWTCQNCYGSFDLSDPTLSITKAPDHGRAIVIDAEGRAHSLRQFSLRAMTRRQKLENTARGAHPSTIYSTREWEESSEEEVAVEADVTS